MHVSLIITHSLYIPKDFSLLTHFKNAVVIAHNVQNMDLQEL